MVDARCAAAQSAAPAHGVRIGGVVRAGMGQQIGALPVGRGRQPRWVAAEIANGRKLEDLLIK